MYKLKEKDEATFYFPAEEWVLPAASTKEPEEREFVGVGTCQENLQAQKKEDTSTFYSHSEGWILPAESTINPEERESVVDSGASMHMVSKKDFNSAELETMRISRSPTTVMTANGEVQTREEVTVYVKELYLFVKVVLLEETRAVFSLGETL